jgi:ATP-dependent DNA helicase RecQ
MEKHLKTTYGFNKFREYQKDIICDLLKGENVFAILPTGGGKSLLYQFPSTYTKSITFVVSPLISLMNDQCMYLNSKNITSICLNSETSVDISTLAKYKIIYSTPEYITSRINNLKSIQDKIGLFAIDESHCVSQWSHDFRESYLALGIIKETYPNIPLLAVTATATPRVIEDIYDLLNLEEINEYCLGTRRTNLEINIMPKKYFEVDEFNEPTIIYVQTRKVCESLYEQLLCKGIKTARYHGGMNKKDKEQSHNMFINGTIMVIVATISFGMGIDKSDIRHVINYGVPNDLETYYQEIGRAGRDGLPSKATLYYAPQDFSIVMYLISTSSDPKQREIKTNAMYLFRKYVEENNICRQQIIDYYFEHDKFPSENDVSDIPKCKMCDNCRGEKLQKVIDISEETKLIIEIINKQHNAKGYTFGINKTVDLIKKTANPLFNNRSKIWIKELLEILITKDILFRKQTKCGFVINIGKNNITSLLPIKVRINNEIIIDKVKSPIVTSEMRLNLLKQLRDKLAKKYAIVPSVYMNDRVILNVFEKKPITSKDLWSVDGISQEFIMMYGAEFLKEYNKINLHKKSKIELTANPSSRLSAENTVVLVERLKKYRTEKAKETDVPPYCVYYDSTINDIISKCPTTKAKLLNVKGFGKIKVERYGKYIIDTCIELQNV